MDSKVEFDEEYRGFESEELELFKAEVLEWYEEVVGLEWDSVEWELVYLEEEEVDGKFKDDNLELLVDDDVVAPVSNIESRPLNRFEVVYEP